MKKVFLFSLFLVLGLVLSQCLPVWLGEAFLTAEKVAKTLMFVCLAFIMINVGREFELDKTKWRSYAADYFIAMATAAVPWIMVAFYYMFLLPADLFGNWDAWKENLLLSRFAAPTSAGILFTMLAAAGLRREWIYKKTQVLAIFDDLDFVLDSPLADFQPASECGRASKAAALALYGKAALQCACDEDFASEKSSYLTTAIEKLTSVWGMRPFGELSEIPYNQIWDLSTQKSCPENIFQINYVQGNADLGSIWNYQFGPSTTGVTSYKIGQMHNMTTGEVYESFDPGDVRRNYLRATTVAGVTYYHTMKYADLECGANGYGGNNWIVLRYADVALMLAEAYYWQGVSTMAETYLNMVRRRAGLADWSGSDLRQGIYDERLFEFIQEGLRWQDVLRMYSNEEMIEHYNAVNSNFSVKDLLLPIPYNERILNPEGLYQNPGYGVE